MTYWTATHSIVAATAVFVVTMVWAVWVAARQVRA